jgi:glycosyltransferase involved in cell wall biosynthesis
MISKNKSVMMILGSMPPMKCGVGDSMVFLASAIEKQSDLEISVLTSIDAVGLDSQNVNYYPIMKDWGMSRAWTLIKKVKSVKPDLVHLQFPSLGYRYGILPYFLPFIFWLLKIRVVQTWHEPPVSPSGSASILYNIKKTVFRLRYILCAIQPGHLVLVEPGVYEELWPIFRLLINRVNTSYIEVASNMPVVPCTPKDLDLVRRKYNAVDRKLVVYFGFAFEDKGVEKIFEMADPTEDSLVLVTTLSARDGYHKKLIELNQSARWIGKVSVTGFLPADEVSKILSSADIVVFPFLDGLYSRSGTYLAALGHGCFSIATSNVIKGYRPDSNTYFAHPEDMPGLKEGMKFQNKNIKKVVGRCLSSWGQVALKHIALYNMLLIQTESRVK